MSPVYQDARTSPGRLGSAVTAGTWTSTSQLLAALVTGLLLILPLRMGLAADSPTAVLAWVLGTLAALVLLAVLLRALGVPRGGALALSMGGIFGVTSVVALLVVVAIGDPGNVALTALSAGIPAIAVAAPAACAVVRWADDDGGAVLMGCLVLAGGLFIAGGSAPIVAGWVDDARDQAREVAMYDASGLPSYLPEVEGTTPTFLGSTLGDAGEGLSYTLRYRADSSSPSTPGGAWFRVEVGRAVGPACRPVPGQRTCRGGNGYVVTGDGAFGTVVTADHDGIRLRAVLERHRDRLPDADTIGAALAGTYTVGWERLLDLRAS